MLKFTSSKVHQQTNLTSGGFFATDGTDYHGKKCLKN